MPVTSIRDIVVHGDDLAIATHGRGFWVMDQMAALRELAAKSSEIAASPAYLFKPGESIAVRQGSMNGTPLPHEEPQELNPPAGVLAYYWLKAPARGPLKLELLDSSGAVKACGASDTPMQPVDTEAINVQAVWMQPAPPPSATAGMHRFALNVPAPRGFGGGGPRPAAVSSAKDACSPLEPALTPNRPAQSAASGGPQPIAGAGRRGAGGLQPGEYTVRLTVDGKTYTQPVAVKPDPRGIPMDHANEGADDRS
jgi:hypothetical protein